MYEVFCCCLTVSVPSTQLEKDVHTNDSSVDRERRMTADERVKVESIRVARANPFSRLERQNTHTAMEKLAASYRSEELPSLEGWLEKKKATAPWSWQKRWVVVAGSYILWSDKQQRRINPKDKAQRDAFGSSINLLSLKQLRAIEKGKTHRKFAFTEQQSGTETEFVWKCATTKDRDFWVDGLQKHIKHNEMLTEFLGTK